MIKKFVLILSLILVVVLGLSLAPVFAKNPNSDADQDIPEQDGIYNVSGHPEMKVRVFVHKAKPEPSPSPLLVCGLTDPNSNALVDPAGWHLPSGAWKYQLNPGSAPSSVGSVNLAVMAKDAFGRWSSVSSNKVSFSQGPNTSANRATYDGKNIIAWGRASASALAVTYIWYYPSTGLVAEVDTIMNSKFPWSWTPYDAKNLCADANSYDAQDILTHELGHWLGLNDEYTSSYANNTMYGYGSKAEVKKDTLTNGDIAGIKTIY